MASSMKGREGGRETGGGKLSESQDSFLKSELSLALYVSCIY